MSTEIDTEHDRLVHDLRHKVEMIIANADEMDGGTHLSMADLQLALSLPDSEPCTNLLRLYDKYLSVTYNPATIRNSLAGLHGAVGGSPDIGWELIPAEVCESLTRAHLNAYVDALKRFRKHRNRLGLARIIAGHPSKMDQLSELLRRGIEDEEQLVAAMREIDFGVARALYEGAL